MEPFSPPPAAFNGGDLQLLYYLALGAAGLLALLLLTVLGGITWLCLGAAQAGAGGCGKASRQWAARPGALPTLNFLLRLSAGALGFLLGLAARLPWS